MSDQNASAKILQKVHELARGLGRDTTRLRSADIDSNVRGARTRPA